jgi:hypothetical protein
MSRGQSRWPRANDGHFLISLLNLRYRDIVNIHLISHKTLQGTDGDRFIHLRPPAGGLAGMRTDATDGSRKGQGPQNDLHGLPVLALGNQRHISMGVYMVGTSIGAGRSIALVDHIATWDGLGIWLVSGLSGTNTLVELTVHGHRTNLGTITTTGAFVQVDVTRLLSDSSLEPSHITGYVLHLGEGKQFDIQMPADLDQFRRDNSHGAIIGGKGLVQLGHNPTDGRASFHQIYLVA